jgi:hypothetical protein
MAGLGGEGFMGIQADFMCGGFEAQVYGATD